MTDKPAWLAGEWYDKDSTTGSSDDGEIRRFFMKPGEERKLIFLTDAETPQPVWEHKVFHKGTKMPSFHTCLRESEGNCPLCDWHSEHGKVPARKTLFMTVIDVEGFVSNRTQKAYTNLKRLYAITSSSSIELLGKRVNRLIDGGKNLRGAQFMIGRTTNDKSPASGDDFEYLEHIDLDTLEDTAEYDYEAITKPDPEAVKRCVERLKTEIEAVSKPVDEADIPF